MSTALSNQEKVTMWKGKLQELREALMMTLHKKGQAAREGDLSENAAFQQADEEAATLQARIINVQKIITDLEKK